MNRFKSITTIIIGAISCIIIAPSLAQITPIIFPQNIVIFPRKNRSIGAIVQLEGLNLPRPKVTGEATIPLEFLDGGKAFTLTATIGEKLGNFLLDTGASTTMVSTETIKKLELTGEPVPQELLTYAVSGDE